MKINQLRLKILGLALLLLPTVLLLIMGMGEMIGGDFSGIQHFVQLLPLVLLAIISWKYPKIGGIILLSLSTVLALVYAVMTHKSATLWAVIINDSVLFLPTLLAGILLMLSSKKH
jgi:hypothetical protein